jgi:hypothetical protein
MRTRLAGLGIWPIARAGIIACVLVVEVVSAVPGRRLSSQHLATPEGEHIVALTQDVLSLVHVERSREAIKLGLIAVAARLLDVRDAVLRPFHGVLNELGSHQNWGLFQLSSRECFRIWVEARSGGGDWTIVYRPHAEDRFELADWLRYRRLRGIYNPRILSGVSEQYDGLVDWLARRIFAADPACTQVRVRMERMDRGTPEQPVRSLGFAFERVRARAEPWRATTPEPGG